MTPTNDPPDPGDQDRSVTLEDLIALRDGDLDAEQARRVTACLESDPAAAALLDELDQTDAILDRLRTQPPPADLSQRIQTRIGKEAAARETGVHDDTAGDDTTGDSSPDVTEPRRGDDVGG